MRYGEDLDEYILKPRTSKSPLAAQQSRGTDCCSFCGGTACNGSGEGSFPFFGFVLTGIRQADVGKRGKCYYRSVACTSFLDTPWMLPVHRRLHRQGCRQRGLRASNFGNTFKPSSHSREEAFRLCGLRLRDNKELLDSLWTLPGTRLVCHCRLSQACHANAIIAWCSSLFPSSYDREALPSPPSERAGAGLSVKAVRGASPAEKDHRRTRVLLQRELDGEEQEIR